MSDKSTIWIEKKTQEEIFNFTQILEEYKKHCKNEISTLEMAMSSFSSLDIKNNPDLSDQLKRCQRGIERFKKILKIQEDLQKAAADSYIKIKDL